LSREKWITHKLIFQGFCRGSEDPRAPRQDGTDTAELLGHARWRTECEQRKFRSYCAPCPHRQGRGKGHVPVRALQSLRSGKPSYQFLYLPRRNNRRRDTHILPLRVGPEATFFERALPLYTWNSKGRLLQTVRNWVSACHHYKKGWASKQPFFSSFWPIV